MSKRSKAAISIIVMIALVTGIGIYNLNHYQNEVGLSEVAAICEDCLPAAMIGAYVGLLLCSLYGTADPVDLLTSDEREKQPNITAARNGFLLFIFFGLVLAVEQTASTQFTFLFRMGTGLAMLLPLSYGLLLLWLHRGNTAAQSS